MASRSGSILASVEAVTTEIDDNGNIVRWIDADQEDITEIVLDGFDRKKEEIDRMGNRQVYTYDSAANVVTLESFGPPDGATASEILLAQRDSRYDERNRPFRSDRWIFHYPGREIGTIDDGALDPGDELVSTINIYDRLSRVVGTVDADDDTYETRYDGLSRVIQTIDPEGNEVARAYDPGSNLLTVTETETSPLIVSDEEFVSSSSYDALGRVVTQVEPNGQTTRSEYDSRGNLVKTVDELGNEVEMRHDRLDRLLDTRTYLSADGTGASALNKDSSQGGGDGIVTIAQTWDDLHRLTSRIDDSGNVSAYVYDDLDRKVRCDYQDDTFETWSYNADSELLTHRNQNGSIETWVHDADSRPTGVTIDNSGASTTVLGTAAKSWQYDGLDRPTLVFDDNGLGDDVTCEYVYDSLSRQIRETQTIGSRLSLAVDSEWQGAGRKVSTTYPNGREVERSYDGLDRLFEIREGGDSSLITRFEYVGPFRDARVTHGNGSVLDKRNAAGSQTSSGAGAGYDANRRHLRHEWQTSGGAQITGYENTYNGPGGIGTNRRNSELREHLGVPPADQQDTYTFDSKYRMLAFDRNGTPSSRMLDGADKMLAFSDEGLARNPLVDGDPLEAGMNQYSSFGGFGRVYDDNSSLRDDGGVQYTYDYQNRLVQMDNGLETFRYLYTADNRRVFKSSMLTFGTRFLYDGWQVVEERAFTAKTDRQNVDGRGIDEHCQIKDYTQIEKPVFYYHGNSQGFVGAISDVDEGVVETYEYSWLGRPLIRDADGNEQRAASRVGNRYMFQGRRFDHESGLYYYRNRYYGPEVGEFVTIDPLGNWEHGQGNGFSAFDENGWHSNDPMGLDSPGCDDPIDDRVETPCFLECCAEHDHCFRLYNCTEESWQDSNPLYVVFGNKCSMCNYNAVACVAACTAASVLDTKLGAFDNPRKYNYYCAVHATFFYDPSDEHMKHTTDARKDMSQRKSAAKKKPSRDCGTN